MFKPIATVALLALAVPCQAAEKIFVASPFSAKNGFTSGIEGPACDREGNLFAVNFERQQTIGVVAPDGQAKSYVTLPGTSIGNGIRFDQRGMMYVADYVNHNVLRVDPKTRKISVFAHDGKMSLKRSLCLIKLFIFHTPVKVIGINELV